MSSCCRGDLFARTLILVLAGLVPALHVGRAQEPRQVVVRLSGQMLAPLIERPIDEVLPVDEVILGARATGQAHVTGQPKLVLADDPQAAAFVVSLTGTIESQTVGRKGPIQIHGRSQTRFTATKRVAYVPERGFVADAAQIAAQTSTHTDRVVADRRGILGRAIERRAWDRVGQNRGQVSQIVQATAVQKIGEAFDRLLDERLTGVNRLADQRYLVAAALRSPAAPHYECCTMQGNLIIAASSGDVPMSRSPAEIVARGQHGPPMQVWIHESVVGDRAAAFLRAADLVRKLVGPAALASQPVAAAASASRSRAGYDLATIGDWIVLQRDQPPGRATFPPASVLTASAPASSSVLAASSSSSNAGESSVEVEDLTTGGSGGERASAP